MKLAFCHLHRHAGRHRHDHIERASANRRSSTRSAEVKPVEPYTITGNFGIYSQYIFRGLTQTDRKPAFQGGFDLATPGGFYAGTWGSNISWLHDAGVVDHGASLEWDFYGGYKYAFNDDWGMDVGVLQYWYPGDYLEGVTKPNTTELYIAGNWKWVSLKYSHAVSNTFGIPDSTTAGTSTCRRTIRSPKRGR